MGGKRVIAVAAGSVLMLAATSVVALAHGFGGGGGHDMWLLARAAGLNQTQIMSAFKNDPNLKTDRASLKSMHDTMMSCLVSPPQQGDCSSQITAFSNALQAMAQERMMVWQVCSRRRLLRRGRRASTRSCNNCVQAGSKFSRACSAPRVLPALRRAVPPLPTANCRLASL